MVAITGKNAAGNCLNSNAAFVYYGFWHKDFRDVNLDVWNIVNQSKKTKAVNLVDNSQRG